MEHYQRGETVMMLYRKGSDRALMSEHLQSVVQAEAALPAEQRRLRQLTYHSARGCRPTRCSCSATAVPDQLPLQNQVYRQARLGKAADAQPFDTAQKESAAPGLRGSDPSRAALLLARRGRQRRSGSGAKGVCTGRWPAGILRGPARAVKALAGEQGAPFS